MMLSVENLLADLSTTLNSYTSSNLTAGATSIPVRNINSFTNQYAVQVGKTGQEQSEIKVIITPSGTALSLYGGGTLTYDHPLDTPVYSIHYDQIVFERSTSGTSGTATPIATVNITPDSAYTEYDDTTGVSTYAYKTYYYNSASGDQSSESDWFIPAGPTFYSLQKLRQRGKDALYNANYLKDNTIVDDWVNEWLEQMNNAAIKVNKGFSIGTASYAFGTAGYGTITEAGFRKATKIEVTWDAVTYTPTIEVPMNEYSETEKYSSVFPRHSWEGDTVFRVLPFGQAGTARFSFGKLATQLVDDTDELPMIMRAYTTSCVNYILFRAYANDTKPELAQTYKGYYEQGKNDFVNEITPRDSTGPKTIELVEGLSGMNENLIYSGDWIV